MIINLTQMKSGEFGIITNIQGGLSMRSRLEAMGIVEGVELKKISAQFRRGPIVVEVKKTKVGIGFGMAQKILIEINTKTLKTEE